LRHAGQAYSGINVLSLWASAMAHGFAAPIWMTYRQAGELGGQVRKGEKGSPVVYANALTKTGTDAASGDEVGETDPRTRSGETIRYLNGCTVFNVEQIDDLPQHYYAPPMPRTEPAFRIAHAESFFAATAAAISHGGNCAFYRPSTDSIQMPPFEAFRDAESYYATLAHEVTHWTAASARCDRQFEGKRFGSEGYAMEELVAELGSAFLCADLDLALEPREDHASYIANWLEVLKGDNRAIFTAASHAQRAADFVNRLQPGASASGEPRGMRRETPCRRCTL
jgi:antirestriction protein ArdC